jgi:hypothetical protein
MFGSIGGSAAQPWLDGWIDAVAARPESPASPARFPALK